MTDWVLFLPKAAIFGYRVARGFPLAAHDQMTFRRQCVRLATFLCIAAVPTLQAVGQAPVPTQAQASPLPASPLPASPLTPNNSSAEIASASSSTPADLFDFKDSDIKFNLRTLMNTLRDERHEGWVLAAYPDPNTHRPLIGAGFSLDVPTTEHPQLDSLNPHPFLEPSSAQLWQAAGLDPALLQKILERFNRDTALWTTKQYRRKIRTHSLTPELTEEEATRLLRISTIQAVYNAKAYCRNFDRLTGPQQMALSQLVFQMGVNLEEFVQFLGAINGDGIQNVSLNSSGVALDDTEYWRTVQTTLIDSQWARRYRGRASTVIAMFDPDYLNNPNGAERRVNAVLHPPSKHRRSQRQARVVRTASSKAPSGKAPSKQPQTTHKRAEA
jgi:hypothetical protein